MERDPRLLESRLDKLREMADAVNKTSQGFNDAVFSLLVDILELTKELKLDERHPVSWHDDSDVGIGFLTSIYMEKKYDEGWKRDFYEVKVRIKNGYVCRFYKEVVEQYEDDVDVRWLSYDSLLTLIHCVLQNFGEDIEF